MWSISVVLTETENKIDSANQNDVAKVMHHDIILQNDIRP